MEAKQLVWSTTAIQSSPLPLLQAFLSSIPTQAPPATQEEDLVDCKNEKERTGHNINESDSLSLTPPHHPLRPSLRAAVTKCVDSQRTNTYTHAPLGLTSHDIATHINPTHIWHSDLVLSSIVSLGKNTPALIAHDFTHTYKIYTLHTDTQAKLRLFLPLRSLSSAPISSKHHLIDRSLSRQP